MSAVKSFIIILAAVRIGVYRQCFFSCIGKYRVSKWIVTAAFTLLWIAEGFAVSISSIGRGIAGMDLFFLLVEVPFLSVVSFGYQGKTIQRLLMAVSLPVIYWIGKWSVGYVFFSVVTDSRRYGIITAVSVGLFFSFGKILEKTEKSKQEREQEWLRQELCMYENQFRIIRQSQHSIRALKHDMKHHIKMLRDMVSNGEDKAALEYLTSMGAFMENREEYVATGNEKIDSILNYMISKAKNCSVDISWEIQIPECLEIPVFDINVILSNLFENAFYALEDAAKPTLYIGMKYDRGLLCINMQNKNSSKEGRVENSEEHGFGLQNIQRIVRKYHGELRTEIKNEEFYVSILLFLEDTE